MSRLPKRARRARRVYYIGTLVMTLGLWAGPASSQSRLTVAPSMVKGPADAPVTIVEFGDYQ